MIVGHGPTPVSWDRGFWESAARGILSMQRCETCGRLQFYPRPVCTACFSTQLSWQPVSGTGVVEAFTLVRVPVREAFRPDVPIMLAEIQLREGVRMISRIVGAPEDGIHVGDEVTVTFLPSADGTSLIPHFRPT